MDFGIFCSIEMDIMNNILKIMHKAVKRFKKSSGWMQR